MAILPKHSNIDANISRMPNKLFISCDWGTSNLRLRIIDADSQKVIAEISSDHGIARINESLKNSNTDRFVFFRMELLREIQQLQALYDSSFQQVPVFISGMASSTIGMMELPYAIIPIAANGKELLIKKTDATDDFPFTLFIISGIATNEDVLRGEESLLAGCETIPGKSELFIFPGTHSKHIFVNNGSIESFKTYMTGELFQLLATKSVLQNSVQLNESEQFNSKAFYGGLEDGTNNNVLHKLFSIRARHVLGVSTKEFNTDYLSGLLIGYELKDIDPSTAQLNLVSEGILMNRYKLALEKMFPAISLKTIASSDALLKAHCRLYASHY